MKRLVLECWLLLLYFEFVMRFRGFKTLHDLVRSQKVRAFPAPTQCTTEILCRAVDLACVFYFKQVLCLQRSAVAAVLLRRKGWQAEMVIGVQIFPFKSHAWVEVQGTVVNDKPYMSDMYRTLERC
jgi:hypothetical protein